MNSTPLIQYVWKLIPALLVLGGMGAMIGCMKNNEVRGEDAVNMAVEWNHFVLDAELNTEGYRGPIAARAYAYIGLAAYETARPGFHGKFRAMADTLTGLILPAPPPVALFDVDLALNACYATIVKHFFLSAPESIRNGRSALEEKWKSKFSSGVSDEQIRASISFGKQVADAVYTWSATDTFGFEANHHNYDRTFIAPAGEGLWKPSPDFPMPALLPYWGKIRPFVIDVNEFIADSLPPFTTATNEIYHQQAVEIISFSKPLTSENQWIAEFWQDDRPGLTFSPAGHWLAITNQVIQKEKPTIEKTMVVYMKMGFALADAMIACWKSKYTYNVMRPETYIQAYIDPNWRPFTPSPSFPSYPSGHSMLGAAAAEILVTEFGSPYAMVDNSHQWLPEYTTKPRKFNSFDEMARENALSRLFIGVHWRFDCEEGLRLGSLIGKKVGAMEIENKLPL